MELLCRAVPYTWNDILALTTGVMDDHDLRLLDKRQSACLIKGIYLSDGFDVWTCSRQSLHVSWMSTILRKTRL